MLLFPQIGNFHLLCLFLSIFSCSNNVCPVPVAARSKTWVCGRSPAEIVGSNPIGGHGCLSVVNFVCFQVEVSVTSWSLVQRSPNGFGGSLYVIRNLVNEEVLVKCGTVAPKTNKTNTYKYKISVETHQFLSKEDVPTWCKQFYYDFIS